jgi:hypothetical protein
MNHLARRAPAQDISPQPIQQNEGQAASHSLSWWNLLLVIACTGSMSVSAQSQNLSLPGTKPHSERLFGAIAGDRHREYSGKPGRPCHPIECCSKRGVFRHSEAAIVHLR